MKSIITGGAGFVGRNLLRVMAEERLLLSDITIIDKSRENMEKLSGIPCTKVDGDLAEYKDWKKEFTDKEVVISLAAQISSNDIDDFERNNVKAIENTIRAAHEYGIKKILHFSSAAVLSSRNDHYSRTKHEGEEIVASSDLDYLILRPSLMYGLTDEKNIGYLIDFSRKSPVFPIPGSGKWPRQPIYVDDVCHLAINSLNAMPLGRKIVSVNGREPIFFDEMVRIVQTKVGGIHFRLYLPVPIFKFAMVAFQSIIRQPRFTTDQVDSLTSNDVFEEYAWWDEFDLEVTSFEKGVEKMVKERQ